MNGSNQILPLRENKELNKVAAAWFHEKWKIPEDLYLESIVSCQQGGKVPQWYVVLNEEGEIIAGLGVIDNDFHKRPDLWPNICAVYVEEAYRKLGIANQMLQFVYLDLVSMGIAKAYLITDHVDFYEKCGFHFYGMIEENSGELVRVYEIGGESL